MFYQIFQSPKVKQWAITSYKQSIYELPHKLLDDLKLRALGNYDMSGKCQNSIE